MCNMKKTVVGYFKRGNFVYEVSTGTKQKKKIPERDHKKVRGNWDLTNFYREHER